MIHIHANDPALGSKASEEAEQALAKKFDDLEKARDFIFPATAKALGLKFGQLYEFEVHEQFAGVYYAQEIDGRTVLHSWQGQNGSMVGRTGFEVDPEGNLYSRLAEPIAAGEEPHFLVEKQPCGHTHNLKPIRQEELPGVAKREAINVAQLHKLAEDVPF